MKRLLTYYGDDFTGSTDVMDALFKHGVRCVLFTRIPTDAQALPFADYEAVGLAGISRSQTPGWMDENLSAAFEWLKRQHAHLCHYKVCSTFDSAPQIGNIGRAIEIGMMVFDQQSVALIVGAPQLRRFTFGGNLFAAYQDEIYRIDRHPVMSVHPVTPMKEADLRLHLNLQTALPVSVAEPQFRDEGIQIIDVYDEATQLLAGHQLLHLAKEALPFVCGSSGVEYAVMRALIAQGDLAAAPVLQPYNRADRIAVVSGSVSPTTERQIRDALTAGFDAISADPIALSGANAGGEMQRLLAEADRILSSGRSPIIHSAMGPASDRGKSLTSKDREILGLHLGVLARDITRRHHLKRLVIAGGDTSGHALGALDIIALTVQAPIAGAPGVPLCRAYSADPELEGLEIALKGGQLGSDAFFASARG
jgi:3-oxoisoapionate kinase